MSKRFWLTAAATVAIAAAAGAAYLVQRGGPDADGHDHGQDADAAPTVIRLIQHPMPVPTFSASDLSGKTVSSADWRGKVVLINFWATWCMPCRVEIPDLVALQNKYRDDLVVVGVSEDEEGIDKVQAFAREHKINYPIVMANAELRKVFPNVAALPTTFVLDRQGRLAKRTVGLLNARETEAVARSLAGLQVNARIEYIDQAQQMQGVDLSRVPAERKTAVLQALNAEQCSCHCGLTVAQCRIDDPTCSVSLPQAKSIIDRHLQAPL
jgi:thiol-disulfide isomerase/thioredoxin